MDVTDSMVSIAELEDIRRPEIPNAPVREIIVANLAPSQINPNVMLKASRADSTGLLNIFENSCHFSAPSLDHSFTALVQQKINKYFAPPKSDRKISDLQKSINAFFNIL